jgi:hypothetical protein
MRLIDGLKEVATLYSDATGTPVAVAGDVASAVNGPPGGPQ